MLLFYPIFVTFARSEKSYSKLKIIINYLRNSTRKNQLKFLSLVAIQKQDCFKIRFK